MGKFLEKIELLMALMALIVTVAYCIIVILGPVGLLLMGVHFIYKLMF